MSSSTEVIWPARIASWIARSWSGLSVMVMIGPPLINCPELNTIEYLAGYPLISAGNPIFPVQTRKPCQSVAHRRNNMSLDKRITGALIAFWLLPLP